MLSYRLGIAWLHFVQPFARLWGRVRGAINRPEAHTRQRRARRGWLAGVGATQIRDALRLCLSLPVETSYWSQRWVEVDDVLRPTANRLRQQRAARHIELDSGWWEDRDLTIAGRTWFRLHVRALVEDHGGGNCLHRLAVRSRLTGGVALPLLLAFGGAAAFRYAGLPWTASATIVAALALVGAVASVLGTSEVVLNALAAVAAESGMTVIPSGRRVRSRGSRAEGAQDRTAGPTLQHGLHDDPLPSRALDRRSVAS